EQIGNPAGSDRAQKKATYTALFGVEAARERAQQALQAALNALHDFDDRADPLRWLAHYAVEREK
ncbi:MAG: hypothetical protein N2651_07540, partial [Fimbriimonadales bacterium]|nr:hypothetical protein [Fimbriimonadales bacterium]